MKSKNYPKEVPLIGRARKCIEAIKNLELDGKTVIDIGCSFGWIEKKLSNSGAKFIGIDPEPSAIDFAKKHSPGKFFVGSALQFPVNKAEGDTVLFFDVIEHLPQGGESQALKEINRVLKTGGVLILTTPNNHFYSNLLDPAWYFGHRHYRKDQLEKLMSKTGFEITQHKVVGSFLAPLYTIWFYLVKHLLGIKHPRNEFMERISDIAYNEDNGIIEHLLFAKKTRNV